MIGTNNDDTQKEFYVRQVEKYKGVLDSSNQMIILTSIGVGLAGIYFILRISGYTFPDQTLFTNILDIAFLGAASVKIISLISNISKKAAIELKIDEIKNYFAYNGLNLENEISKSKGK